MTTEGVARASCTYHESTFDQWEESEFAAVRDEVFFKRPALKMSEEKNYKMNENLATFLITKSINRKVSSRH